MPPKITVTRDQVLDAAFEIVRSEGPEKLSARSVAQALGCSTQPIYRAYGSMNQLHDDVFARASQVAMGFLLGDGSEPSFLTVGYGNLRFAQQEPQLYRVVIDSQQAVDLLAGGEPPEFVVAQMRQLPELADMEDEQISRIFALLWFFSQGVATLFRANAEGDPMPMAREYLAMAGEAVIAYERSRS